MRLLEVVAGPAGQAVPSRRRAPRASRRTARAAPPARPSDSVVGGVAHEEMTEAEGILAGETAAGRGESSSLRTSAVRLGRESRLFGRECLDNSVVEPLPLERNRARAPIALVARAGRAAPRAAPGGPRAPPTGLRRTRVHHRRHLLHEERVPARGAQDPLPYLGRRALGVDLRIHQQLGFLGERGWNRTTPLQPVAAIEQLGPRHADQQHRCAGRQERNVLEQIEEDVLGPAGCHRRRRRAGWSVATASSSLRNAHAISSGEDVPLLSEDDAERLGRNWIELEPASSCGSSCFSTSTTGQ